MNSKNSANKKTAPLYTIAKGVLMELLKRAYKATNGNPVITKEIVSIETLLSSLLDTVKDNYSSVSNDSPKYLTQGYWTNNIYTCSKKYRNLKHSSH